MTVEQADLLISLVQSTNTLLTILIFLTLVFRFWRGGSR